MFGIEELKKDWTHKYKEIKDIRKLSELYMIYIDDKKIKEPLFVKNKIFEERLKSYFLVRYGSEVSREQILSVTWNFYITQGYYIKIVDGTIQKFYDQKDSQKYYISFLEIDGLLGTFESVYKEK